MHSFDIWVFFTRLYAHGVRLIAHEARINDLEKRPLHAHAAPSSNTQIIENDQTNHFSPTAGSVIQSVHLDVDSNTPTSQPLRCNLDTVELASPITTLRSLGALESDRHSWFHPCDPINCGVLRLEEAQQAVHIYFDYCHPWAPALNEGLRHTAMDLRQSSPPLFLAVVSVGARFWYNGSVHPRYFDIVTLLDKTVSQLLLRPSPRDANIDTVRALMLYLQWMPCDQKRASIESSSEPPSRQSKTRTRYNDMSAWAIFGLVLRYASFINLEHLTFAPFRDTRETSVSKEATDNMRTWFNIITYDCNLTLTSGLPVSTDPSPAARISGEFCRHAGVQDPGDIRYGALAELACIVQRAKSTEGLNQNVPPGVANLKKANVEIEEWERHWLRLLKYTTLQYIQLPFTSSRWYRLSLNSSLLRPLLSPSTRTQSSIDQLSILGFLETSLTAASQILLSLTTHASHFIWDLKSQSYDSYPSGDFAVDPVARKSLHHAVDATWISFTFALTFLVLCYIRARIDDDLQILGLSATTTSTTCVPSRPRPNSILARLTRLALDIFEAETEGPEFRSGGGYEAVIRDAASAVLDKGQEQLASITQDPLDPAFRSLFELLDDTVYEWPSVYDEATQTGSSFADIWGPR
ncbi:hypothetical protein BDV96DRAFT_647399 [Lophiotrema nucula]|uniref:Transcription factor domain-containing protein n=1 Tax=Lophiotrema nucula TaxID=690887 RepID=A0A6A5Z650_9PLEO|nr:hypothetical protein BDV96DRAFT_647399 [Lophiotrema nucula]